MSDRTCAACHGKISTQNKSGFCRACVLARVNSDPEIKARRAKTTAAILASPEGRAKLRAGMARYIANMPESDRERRRQQGKRNLAIALHSPEARARANSPEVRKLASERRYETMMAWCPPEWRAKYHEFIRKGRKKAWAQKVVLAMAAGAPEPEKFQQQRSRLAWCPENRLAEYKTVQKAVGAVEARRIIEADMTPLERQLSRLRTGATLVSTFKASRAGPSFTLGGVAPEAM